MKDLVALAKEFHRRIDRIDRYILYSAISAFFVALILLIDDRIFFSTGAKRGSAEEVATVIKSNSDVRRRMDDDVIWFPMSQQDTVFQGDSIFTGEASGAEVSFKDNTRIVIGPKTLIKIIQQNGSSVIDLGHGSAQVDIGSKNSVTLVTSGKSIKLSGKNARLEVSSAGKGSGPKLKVISGSVDLANGWGSKKTLVQNQTIDVPEDGDVKKIDVVALEPTPEPTPSIEVALVAEPSPTPTPLPEPLEPVVIEVPPQQHFVAKLLPAPPPPEPKAPAEIAGGPLIYDSNGDLFEDKIPRRYLMSIEPLLGFKILSGADSSGGEGALTSQSALGVAGDLAYRWTLDLKSSVFARLQKMSIQPVEGATLEGASKTLYEFGGSLGYSLSDRLSFVGSVGLGSQLFAQSYSTDPIVIDSALVPFIAAEGAFDIYRAYPITLTGKLGFKGLLPKTGEGYTIDFGLGYFGKLMVRREIGRGEITGSLFLSSVTQNTSISTKKDTELGLQVGYALKFGPGI